MGEKKEQVRGMFDGIASRYDFLNHFLSAGIDRRWRKRLVKTAAKQKPSGILDVATGTGDLAIALSALPGVTITGTDISGNMLNVGEKKIQALGLDKQIRFQQADAECLPFEEGQFDLVTVAFGVRNFEDLDLGLREMCRVLRPGGQVLILEFSKVTSFPFRQVYAIYFKYILPLLGRLISRHSFAYNYLPQSVGQFPSGREFLDRMAKAGYSELTQLRLSGGIATLYSGFKK